MSDKDAIYTITGTLDERHKETDINGYLSYSENEELLYTPLVYSGDTAYVSTCQKFTGYNAEEILEFTDMLSNSVVADNEIKEILEQILEGTMENKEKEYTSVDITVKHCIIAIVFGGITTGVKCVIDLIVEKLEIFSDSIMKMAYIDQIDTIFFGIILICTLFLLLQKEKFILT